MHVAVALGTIHTLRQEVAAAVAEPVVAATACAPAQDVAHAAETGWAQGTSAGPHPARRTAGRWGLVTTWGTVWQIHLRRGQAAATAGRGECAGSLSTERWTGDRWWPLARRPLCWAPLSRDVHTSAARGGAAPRSGAGLLAQPRPWWALWSRVRAGTLTRAGFAAAVVASRAEGQPWRAAGGAYDAARGEKAARARTARTCRAWLNVAPARWLLVRGAGVAPTNTAAARALRPAVSWRRTSRGTPSALGSPFVARMLTVPLALRVQQRPVRA